MKFIKPFKGDASYRSLETSATGSHFMDQAISGNCDEQLLWLTYQQFNIYEHI
jgi:hypothetical protein